MTSAQPSAFRVCGGGGWPPSAAGHTSNHKTQPFSSKTDWGEADAEADGETDAEADGETDAEADGETDAEADGETDTEADGETDAAETEAGSSPASGGR